MKTATFYSYKGGVGRSLLLANVAHGLAKSGKRSIAIDFDLEAPGLHWKLKTRAPAGAGLGLVRYLLDAVSADSEEDSGSPGLDAYIAQVPGECNLDVMAAVDVNRPTSYWADFAALSARTSGQPYAHLHWLLDLLGRLQTRYDYCLLDARTGISDISSLPTTILSDSVVLCMLDTQESLEGTLAVCTGISKAPPPIWRNDVSVRTIIPVFSRVPLDANSVNILDGLSDTRLQNIVSRGQALRASSDVGSARFVTDRQSSVYPVMPFVIRQATELQRDERVVLEEPRQDDDLLSLDYLRVLHALEPELNISNIQHELLRALNESVSNTRGTEILAQLCALQFEPRVGLHWLRAELLLAQTDRSGSKSSPGLSAASTLGHLMLAARVIHADPSLASDVGAALHESLTVAPSDAAGDDRIVDVLDPSDVNVDSASFTRKGQDFISDALKQLSLDDRSYIASLLLLFDPRIPSLITDTSDGTSIAHLVRMISSRGSQASRHLRSALRLAKTPQERRQAAVLGSYVVMSSRNNADAAFIVNVASSDIVRQLHPALLVLANRRDEAMITLAGLLASAEESSVQTKEARRYLHEVGGDDVWDKVSAALSL